MLAESTAAPGAFGVERLGVLMSPSEDPREAWGVLNPAGVRGPDGEMHLFPRIIAEGNYSRIAHAQVKFAGGNPVSASRLGIALEPHEPDARRAARVRRLRICYWNGRSSPVRKSRIRRMYTTACHMKTIMKAAT